MRFYIFPGVANPDPCLHGGNHPHLTLFSPSGAACRLQIMSVSLVLTYYVLVPSLRSVNLCCGYGSGTLPSTYLEYSF